MSIKESFNRFRNMFNFIQPESLFDLENLDVSFIDKELHGPVNQIRTDLLGQIVSIGDIVSYGQIGSYKGLSVGVLLGYTPDGYRVARIYKDPHVSHFYCSEIQTPGQVTVVKGKK